MRHPRAALAISLLLVGSATSARGDFVVASNLPAGYQFSSFDIGIGYSGTGFVNEAAAQEFTAGAGGQLTTLTATVGQVDPGSEPLIVSIYSAAGAVPGTLLGSATFSPSQVSPNVYNSLSSFDLSSKKIALIAGASYFAAFTVATPIGGDDRYEAILLNPNPSSFGIQPVYSRDGGTTWLPEGIPNEIGLTVRAQTVPEPGSLALVAIGGLTSLGLARARVRAKSAEARR